MSGKIEGLSNEFPKANTEISVFLNKKDVEKIIKERILFNISIKLFSNCENLEVYLNDKRVDYDNEYVYPFFRSGFLYRMLDLLTDIRTAYFETYKHHTQLCKQT